VPEAPFFALGEHFAIDLPGARAVFTTRRGGHSGGPYASLNLGVATGDDPELVRRNRATLARTLGVTLTGVRQVHGTAVHRVEAPTEGPAPHGDGQVTTTPGLAPMALAADCLPVIVATPGAVAVLHAGWRGLAGGILAEGVRALREAAADGGPVVAAIGPGVGGCCYEVGPEVHAAFAGYGPVVRDGDRIDLKAVARAALGAAGVDTVHDIGRCTLCGDPELFFSHRRDGGVTGRQAGVVWLS
jgi:YfiH family protein